MGEILHGVISVQFFNRFTRTKKREKMEKNLSNMFAKLNLEANPEDREDQETVSY